MCDEKPNTLHYYVGLEQLMCTHLGGTAAKRRISPIWDLCFGGSASPFVRLFSSSLAHNSACLYHSHVTGCHNHQHYATSMGLIYKSGHGFSAAPAGKHQAAPSSALHVQDIPPFITKK